MFYIINKDFEILGVANGKNNIENVVIKCMLVLTKQKNNPIEAKSWDACEDGYYYIKDEDSYTLRKYTKLEGYIYNSYIYEEICKLKITEFNG